MSHLKMLLSDESSDDDDDGVDSDDSVEDIDSEDEGYTLPPSGSDRIADEENFEKLINLISEIQWAHGFPDPAAAATVNTASTIAPTSNDDGNNTDANSDPYSSNQAYRRQVEILGADVHYIRNRIKSNEIGTKTERIDELLHDLMDAAFRSKEDFGHDSANLNQLLRIVLKLKLQLPPRRPRSPETSETVQKKKKKRRGLPYTSSKEKKKAATDILKDLLQLKVPNWGMAGLLRSYESLAVNQKLCLLCFSVFPFEVDKDEKGGLITRSLEIKKKILIYWWVGEGLIDVAQEEDVSTADANITKRTIEEIGEQILEVLTEKGFLEPEMERGRESGSCRMHPFVHSFVTALAKRAGFFDFNNEDGRLKPSFTRSQRACLLTSTDNLPSSCQLWAKYIRSSHKLKRFEKVQTLFNVNESIIDIRPEWFSKMKYMSVLHLGSWHSGTEQHIEVVDQRFLEELKNMKQLKLFSLQGESAIMKLPESFCNLSNLKILNLRKCHKLEELPSDIASLKNLTHLDVTKCLLVTKLPKGISLLPKLEVLRGFVINDEAGDPQDKNRCILSLWWKKAKECVIDELFRCKNKEICTLRDLLKVEKLRELSILVYRYNFPDSEEFEVFKGMRKLQKLKISWVRSLKEDESSSRRTEEQIATNQEALTASKYLGFMTCCKQQPDQPDTKKETRREFRIQTLQLWCYPSRNAPKWLVPDQLKNLQKLYIKGGNLVDLLKGTGENNWKVSTLHLKYLHDLVGTWNDLMTKFPNLTYLEIYECDRLGLIPCDEEGVWKKDD